MPSKRKSSKKSKSTTNFITIAIVVILVAVGAYFVTQYKQSDVEEEGIVTCSGDTCEKSVHIHSVISASVCGEEVDFDRHKGDTNEQHTHDEDEEMHFHNRMQVDPETEEPLDPSPLFVGNFFDNLDIAFSKECLDDKCNGELCPTGKPGRVHMTVNGKDNPLLNEYPWQDGDIINVSFE